MKVRARIELGDEVKDPITGFQGIAIGRTEWLYNCDRIVVQPKAGKDGVMKGGESFDEPQLEIVKRGKIKVNPPSLPAEGMPVPTVGTAKTGGPRMTPMQRETPSRY